MSKNSMAKNRRGSADTPEELRFGIRADTTVGWAKVLHIPAINGLSGVKLAAVTARNEQTAREAAEAFGADRWFSDRFGMIRDDQVDLVTIAVTVRRLQPAPPTEASASKSIK